MIRLENLSKSYDDGASWAVRNVDLQVDRGSLTALIGESGSGKTTVLKMINRLIEPSSGSVHIDENDVFDLDPVQLRRGIGYVFQGIGLFPHWDVVRNIAAVPHLLNWELDRIVQRVDELLELVGLPPDEYRHRNVNELSGGQQQRVGLARALAAEPRILLMDEPFGALDPVTRDDLQEEFDSLRRRLGLTVVLVTHDMTEALILADRIAILREGELLMDDTPSGLMSRADDEYVRRLLHHPRTQVGRLREVLGDDFGREERA